MTIFGITFFALALKRIILGAREKENKEVKVFQNVLAHRAAEIFRGDR